MPCINAPANTCGAARRTPGHGALRMSAAQPMTMAVKEKRAIRKNCRSACGSTALATINPVDQINTNTKGTPSRSMFNGSPNQHGAVRQKNGLSVLQLLVRLQCKQTSDDHDAVLRRPVSFQRNIEGNGRAKRIRRLRVDAHFVEHQETGTEFKAFAQIVGHHEP